MSMNYVVDTVKDIEKHADRADEQRQALVAIQ
jgi:hypothetical protein